MTTKCDVSWCENQAEFVWVRTAKELKSMRGPKLRGVRAEASPERKVCAVHKPSWREDVYARVAS